MLKLVKSVSLAVALSLPLAAHATTIVKPYTFTPSTPAQAAQVNANFDAIYNDYNGNITNANIKANAGISFSKLAFTSQLGPILRAATNECIGVGTTGDSVSRWSAWTDGSNRYGSGSAAADTQLLRPAANTLQLSNPATTDYGALRLKDAGFYPTTADTQPSVNVKDTGVYFGAGGAAAPDLRLLRESSSILALKDAAGTNYKAIDVSAIYINGAGPLSPVTFGGDGSDGVVTQGNASYSGTKRINATQFNQTPATTMTVTDGALNINANSGTTNFTGNVVMACSSTQNGGLGGGTGSTSLTGAPGGGPGGGPLSQYTGAGGNGGASFIGSGGAGGHNGTSGQAGTTTKEGGVFFAQTGGGSGGNSIVMTATSNGGLGGTGQHQIVISSTVTINFFSTATISSQGGSGTAGAVATTSNAAGGGGGGSGGDVLIASQAQVVTSAGAVVNLSGGVGGAAGRNVSGNAGGGGGGGAGTLLIWTPSFIDNGWTLTLSGGAGGAAIGTGAAGATGESTTLQQVTGTPNNPLIVHFQEHPEMYRPHMRMINQIAKATHGAGLKKVEIPHNLMCQIASEGSFVKYAKLITERGLQPLSESTCLGVGDNTITEALKNAS